jgi:lipopolysaccharide export LptBFGC system permease protein LptF
MSKIQEKLDSLQPHVVGIRFLQGMQIVDAVFKKGWVIPESTIIRRELVDESQNYYMFYTENEGITIDDLLDYVENIINVNIEREKKNELLKLKVKELQVLFKETSLVDLESLSFNLNHKKEDDTEEGSMMDMDVDRLDFTTYDDSELSVSKETEITEEKEEITSKPTVVSGVNKSNVIKHNGNNIELPPKNGKVIVEDFNIPNIICKCGDDDICPECEEEKMERL